jgi:hypothetical protein
MKRGLLLLAAIPLLAAELTPESFDHEVRSFVESYCIDCHDEDTQKGERRFDTLAFPIADDNALIDFQDMLDQLNLGEMPPKKKKQPHPEAKLAVIAWLTEAVDAAQKARTHTGGETVLRRLNRREYLNTVRDLLQLQTSSFDPTEGFPAERKVHHLDNQGHALVTSGFLLERYLQAADQIIEKVLPPLTRPEVQAWDFRDGFRQQAELDSRHIRIEKAQGQTDGRPPTTMRLYEHPRSMRHMGSHGPLAEFASGAPADGYYDITIWAEARHRKPKDLPHQLAIVPGHAKYSDLHLPQPIEPELARFALRDDGVGEYSARVWLDKGITPRFTFPNGPDVVRPEAIRLGKQLFKTAGRQEYSVEESFVEGLSNGALREIRIHRVRIQGPHFPEWPSATQRELLGGEQFDPAQNARNIRRFLDRALRRPARDEEVAQILAVVAAREAKGIAPFDAFQDGLKAVLCLPAFLYLDEPLAPESETIDEYAIASRLSYFLWASMPDAELLALAAAGKLREPETRRKQVDRLLANPKSDAFIDGFLNSWLTLGALGETPPDRSRFGVYYSHDLQQAMRRETQLFTRHILDERLSIDLFLKSDFTFLNRHLAQLYGVKHDFQSDEFERVKLGNHAFRGGLLGQASVLTVSANGVDTSPVVRGIWLLENILGTPPPPPPPDVEPLDPDVRGAKSIRDQLQRHRSDESCAECHRKIDPLGFALENFDAIGRFRPRYQRGPKIDASGALPNGATFANFTDFRALLLKERAKFARALTEKLMAYALGRPLDIGDRPTTDQLLHSLEQNERSFRALIEQIVISDIFTRP